MLKFTIIYANYCTGNLHNNKFSKNILLLRKHTHIQVCTVQYDRQNSTYTIHPSCQVATDALAMEKEENTY